MKVFLLCSGLGRVNRGYESFTRECYDALKDEPGLELTVFKGGGASRPGDVTLWNLPRDSFAARWVGKLPRRGAYGTEQITYTLALLPYLLRYRPEVIFFSDGNVGNVLWHFRRLTGLRYKLLFSNGGPLSPPFGRCDFGQQGAPTHAEAAIRAGLPPERQAVVPYAFRFDPNPPPSADEISTLRRRLDLPVDRPVVITVGALNATHKRIDYVVQEMAFLPAPRPFLVLLGQADDETPAIRELAIRSLGTNDFLIRTVPAEEVAGYLRAADLFVLASFSEGFGRVLGEACGQGLPCLVHDYPLMHYVLGETGVYLDARQEGALAAALGSRLKNLPSAAERLQIREAAQSRFGWPALAPEYLRMFRACVRGR